MKKCATGETEWVESEVTAAVRPWLELRRPLPEVPAELDRRILLAAAVRRSRRIRRGRWLRITAAAAALMVMVGGVLYFRGEPVPEALPVDHEALALWDWTGVEQAGYNLNFELDSRQAELAYLAMR